MNIVDKKIYIVAFRKTSNDDWETSGATYGNLIDAEHVRKGLTQHTDWQTHVFVAGKFRFVTNAELKGIIK